MTPWLYPWLSLRAGETFWFDDTVHRREARRYVNKANNAVRATGKVFALVEKPKRRPGQWREWGAQCLTNGGPNG